MQKRVHFLGVIFSALFLCSTSSAQPALRLCPAADAILPVSGGSYFYSSDLRYEKDLGELTAWIKALDKALKAEGTLLVLTPTPTRGMVWADEVDTAAAKRMFAIDFNAAKAQQTYHNFIKALSPTLAVDLLDVAEGMKAQTPSYFQKYDRHWTPEGARASAYAVAKVILKNPNYQKKAKPAPLQFQTRRTGEVRANNKIYASVEKACGDLLMGQRETMTTFKTRQRSFKTAQPSKQRLFADAVPFVALAGNSFSTDKFNYAGFLSEGLRQPVLNFAISGGKFYTGLEDLLLNRKPGDPPRVIIWEQRYTDLRDTAKAKDFTPFREIIAAVHGPCTGSNILATAKRNIQGGNTSLFTGLAPKNAVGPAYYLHLNFSDLSLVAYTVKTVFADGDSEKAHIERSKRMRNTGAYYLEMSRTVTSDPVAQIQLQLPKNASGTVTAQFCKVAS